MKVRIIRKPEYQILCHLQVKKWWYLGWKDIAADDLKVLEQRFEAMIENGEPNIVFFEGVTK